MSDMTIEELLAALTPPQYGNSMHFPHCIDRRCTGCLPPLGFQPVDEPDEPDPVVKYDGAGQPVRASDRSLGNRAERRRLAREARRRR